MDAQSGTASCIASETVSLPVLCASVLWLGTR